MVRPFTVLLSLLWLGITSCVHFSAEDVHGAWVAVEATDDDDTAEVDLTAVRLLLQDNEQFEYHPSQRESLSGTYRIGKDLLTFYVSDPQPDTLQVHLMDHSEDTIVLRMNHKNRDRRLKMMRSPQGTTDL